LNPHLAIVPLPFVGHEHAAGQLLGVALIMPRAATDDERRAVYGAVARWEAKYRQEDEDAPTVQLNLGTSGELFLERVELGVVQASLRSDVWCRPANVWSSVTPVALDRNPGDLRSRDARKLADALDEATETVRRACERLALPRPHSVEVLPAAPWAGATKARHYPPFPGDAGRTQRVLTHVRLVFHEPVPGPMLLGAGRFVGLGLCRPERTR
jgi:CRISPR-associated protein Csb2